MTGTLTSMATDATPDPTAFLERLSTRDADAAQFARRLIDQGWTVSSLVGPVQMDVWELILERDDERVRFGIERGLSDGVGTLDSKGVYRPMS